MRLFLLIWMSHYDKQTHTYSLKTCVYTQQGLQRPCHLILVAKGAGITITELTWRHPFGTTHIPDLVFSSTLPLEEEDLHQTAGEGRISFQF